MKASKPQKVLIIDDEEDICQLLAAIISNRGFEVKHALSLESGLVAYERFRPQLVFLDLNVKEVSGFSIIPALRNIQPDVMIAIISAYDGPAEKKQALEEKVNYFIGKPLKKEAITPILNDLL